MVLFVPKVYLVGLPSTVTVNCSLVTPLKSVTLPDVIQRPSLAT
jgi:hypothetical protein